MSRSHYETTCTVFCVRCNTGITDGKFVHFADGYGPYCSPCDLDAVVEELNDRIDHLAGRLLDLEDKNQSGG